MTASAVSPTSRKLETAKAVTPTTTLEQEEEHYKTIICTLLITATAVTTALAQPATNTLQTTYSLAKGIGPEKGVMRRDPSDIIKVGDLYYVWYSKCTISPGYDLEAGLSQTRNLYREHPEVVEEMKSLLQSYAPANARSKPKRKRK